MASALRRVPGTSSGPSMSFACSTVEMPSDKSSDRSKPSLLPAQRLRILLSVKDTLLASASMRAPAPGSASVMSLADMACTEMLQGVVHAPASQHVDAVTCVADGSDSPRPLGTETRMRALSGMKPVVEKSTLTVLGWPARVSEMVTDRVGNMPVEMPIPGTCASSMTLVGSLKVLRMM